MQEREAMKGVRMLLCLSALVLFIGCCFIKWDSAFKFLSQVPVLGLVIGYNFRLFRGL